MAPNRGSASKSSNKSNSANKKSSSSSSTVAPRVSKSNAKSAVKRPLAQQQKNKPRTAPELKKKKREYTEKELNLPQLNKITPVGVQKPKGKKKGKVFVDDKESMLTILAMVNAEKEGQIESKMMKARQMEEIREAKRKEAEARQEQKKMKLEETKESLRRKRKRKNKESGGIDKAESSSPPPEKKAKKKRVSFA
ncbi:hypothetical protein VTO42DRAFT_3585 [Malbranchea cinnamomea]